MAPAILMGLQFGIPAIIKLAEKLIPDRGAGKDRKDFVVNSTGSLLDTIARKEKVSPQDVAPLLGGIVDLVFGLMDERGEVNQHKLEAVGGVAAPAPPLDLTTALKGEAVIFKGVLSRV